MLTDTFDIQAKFTRICGAIATQILFESKSPVFKKNHLFSGGKCDSCDEDERRRCATAIIVKWWNEVIIMVKLSFTIIKMAAVADSNDLTSNWRKIRLKPISLRALLSILILLLPQPQNAMPIPKIQQNSLTSAMVSFKINLIWNRSNQTVFKLGRKSAIITQPLPLFLTLWFSFIFKKLLIRNYLRLLLHPIHWKIYLFSHKQ